MAIVGSKYFAETAKGLVFTGSTAAAGTALPISTGTAVTFGLWNTNPNKCAVLLRLDVGFTSGTIALGEFGIANQYCGFSVGSSQPLTAFNDGTPKNALLGMGNASSMRFTPAATTTLAAGGTAVRWLGAGQESATAGTGLVGGFTYDFDGSLIVTPGQLVFLCGSVAQTALFTCSLTWAEVPNSEIPGLYS